VRNKYTILASSAILSIVSGIILVKSLIRIGGDELLVSISIIIGLQALGGFMDGGLSTIAGINGAAHNKAFKNEIIDKKALTIIFVSYAFLTIISIALKSGIIFYDQPYGGIYLIGLAYVGNKAISSVYKGYFEMHGNLLASHFIPAVFTFLRSISIAPIVHYPVASSAFEIILLIWLALNTIEYSISRSLYLRGTNADEFSARRIKTENMLPSDLSLAVNGAVLTLTNFASSNLDKIFSLSYLTSDYAALVALSTTLTASIIISANIAATAALRDIILPFKLERKKLLSVVRLYSFSTWSSSIIIITFIYPINIHFFQSRINIESLPYLCLLIISNTIFASFSLVSGAASKTSKISDFRKFSILAACLSGILCSMMTQVESGSLTLLFPFTSTIIWLLLLSKISIVVAGKSLSSILHIHNCVGAACASLFSILIYVFWGAQI
jgi:hypothetical protein